MTREEIVNAMSLKDAIQVFKDTNCYGTMDIAKTVILKALEQEPKTGHWIEKEGFDGDTYYDCSECGEAFCLIDGTPTDNLYNYCPNCGAKMEGGGECLRS